MTNNDDFIERLAKDLQKVSDSRGFSVAQGNCIGLAKAAAALMREEIKPLVEALERAKMQAEYIHVALSEPAKKNPVCASLRVWSGGIIRDCEQALSTLTPTLRGDDELRI